MDTSKQNDGQGSEQGASQAGRPQSGQAGAGADTGNQGAK